MSERAPIQSRDEYNQQLQDLSEASVNRHFDAFRDIAWDDPDFEIDPQDPRWILGTENSLGAHEWYRNLPEDRQIEVGFKYNARITKVGLQFEQVLVAGIMNHNIYVENGNPEFRYSMHEATEETQHIQMFQEFVNRTGLDVKGAPRWFREAVPPLAFVAARAVPAAFFMGVLAGEEPIDHTQKDILRQTRPQHPAIQTIMHHHVAEEARHIGYAHLYLQQHVPNLSRLQKAALAAYFPVVMSIVGDAILKPSKQELKDMGIPKDVAKDVWWEAPESQAMRRELYSDARMLADHLGLRNGDTKNHIGRAAWRLCGIDGRPSRFRNEPQYAAVPTHEAA